MRNNKKRRKSKVLLTDAVNRYLPEQKKTFPYEKFADYSQKEKKDSIGIGDALVAFNDMSVDLDITTEEYRRCINEKRSKEKSYLKMNNKPLLLGGVFAAAVGGYLWNKSSKSIKQKRAQLIELLGSKTEGEIKTETIAALNSLSKSEVKDYHLAVFEYGLKGITQPVDLATRIDLITDKYPVLA